VSQSPTAEDSHTELKADMLTNQPDGQPYGNSFSTQPPNFREFPVQLHFSNIRHHGFSWAQKAPEAAVRAIALAAGQAQRLIRGKSPARRGIYLLTSLASCLCR
jgi:hypothetical protein